MQSRKTPINGYGTRIKKCITVPSVGNTPNFYQQRRRTIAQVKKHVLKIAIKGNLNDQVLKDGPSLTLIVLYRILSKEVTRL